MKKLLKRILLLLYIYCAFSCYENGDSLLGEYQLITYSYPPTYIEAVNIDSSIVDSCENSGSIWITRIDSIFIGSKPENKLCYKFVGRKVPPKIVDECKGRFIFESENIKGSLYGDKLYINLSVGTGDFFDDLRPVSGLSGVLTPYGFKGIWRHHGWHDWDLPSRLSIGSFKLVKITN